MRVETGRVVLIRYTAPGGARCVGSGLLIDECWVLTADHVAEGSGHRVECDRGAAAVAEVVRSGTPEVDLAVLRLAEPFAGLVRLGCARVDRSRIDRVSGCAAVGFPRWRKDGDRRRSAQVEGWLPTAEGLESTADAGLRAGWLTLVGDRIPGAPEIPVGTLSETAPSPWGGMSGAVVAAGELVVGVVRSHNLAAGGQSLTVTPVTAVDQLPSELRQRFWDALGMADPGVLHVLPESQPESAYWATIREIRARTPLLARRAGELAEIHAFVTGPAGYRWLTGRAWAGKTALLAEAAIAEQNGDVDVVAYFLSRREGDADSNKFLTAVTIQLADLASAGEEVRAADIHQFRALWARAVQHADDTHRPLLLVVDGLDEDLRPAGSPSVAAVLPSLVGDPAHILVSSRSHQELPLDLPIGHPLTGTTPVELTAFEDAASLAKLAQQEIVELVGRPGRLALHILGLLAAAAGPLAVGDLIRLSRLLDASATDGSAQPMAELSLDEVIDVDRFLTEDAARSLQQVGVSEDTERRRYQYAHDSLLEYAQKHKYLGDRRFQNAIHSWADVWRDADWPVIADSAAASVPRYLLTNYPATLHGDPDRLAGTVGDFGWVVAALQVVGVDDVLATLVTARSATADQRVTTMLALVREQERPLRPPNPLSQPGYITRQLCLQAAKLGEDRIAETARTLLQSLPDPGLVPLQATYWKSRAADPGRQSVEVRAVAVLYDGRVVWSGDDWRVWVWDPAAPTVAPMELGHHDGTVGALAVLPDHRVVSGGDDGRVRLWNPATPGAEPVELGQHNRGVWAVAGLPDGRVVSSDDDGRVRLWNPATPGAEPVELGQHNRTVRAVAGLPDGRVVSSDDDGRVRLWNPATPGAEPVELGRHDGAVRAVAGLPDNRVLSGAADGRVQVWDPAAPGAGPVELGRHDRAVRAVAVLSDSRIASATRDGQMVSVWDVSHAIEIVRAACPVTAIAVTPAPTADQRLFTADEAGVVTVWSVSSPKA